MVPVSSHPASCQIENIGIGMLAYLAPLSTSHGPQESAHLKFGVPEGRSTPQPQVDNVSWSHKPKDSWDLKIISSYGISGLIPILLRCWPSNIHFRSISTFNWEANAISYVHLKPSTISPEVKTMSRDGHQMIVSNGQWWDSKMAITNNHEVNHLIRRWAMMIYTTMVSS